MKQYIVMIRSEKDKTFRETDEKLYRRATMTVTGWIVRDRKRVPICQAACIPEKDTVAFSFPPLEDGQEIEAPEVCGAMAYYAGEPLQTTMMALASGREPTDEDREFFVTGWYEAKRIERQARKLGRKAECDGPRRTHYAHDGAASTTRIYAGGTP